jgi:hypothetical protein
VAGGRGQASAFLADRRFSGTAARCPACCGWQLERMTVQGLVWLSSEWIASLIS